MCLCLSVRFSYSLFIVQTAPLSFPQIIWPLALGRAARVNRPQLISLNGRPSLFPEPSTQLLLRLLRHLLNCSLLSPTKGSSTNWSGFFDWDLDVDPRWTFGAIFSGLERSPGVPSLPAVHLHPGDPSLVLDTWSATNPSADLRTRHRRIFLSGDASTTLWAIGMSHVVTINNHQPSTINHRPSTIQFQQSTIGMKVDRSSHLSPPAGDGRWQPLSRATILNYR